MDWQNFTIHWEPYTALNTKRWNWRPFTLHSPPRPIVLLPWMGAIGMHVTRIMNILCTLYCVGFSFCLSYSIMTQGVFQHNFQLGVGVTFSITLEKAMAGDLGKSLWPRTILVLFFGKLDLVSLLDTLPLLWEPLWWLGMATQMQQSIKSCAHCLQPWGWPVQSAFTPNCGHCSDGPLACRLD